MQSALEDLGYKTVHHMHKVLQNPSSECVMWKEGKVQNEAPIMKHELEQSAQPLKQSIRTREPNSLRRSGISCWGIVRYVFIWWSPYSRHFRVT